MTIRGKAETDENFQLRLMNGTNDDMTIVTLRMPEESVLPRSSGSIQVYSFSFLDDQIFSMIL